MARLTHRFVDALAFATERHSAQQRKGTEVPYVSHLLGTCALVLEAGGDEDEAIAALLHDTLEDQVATYDEIQQAFGDRVSGIVRDCSDTEVDPKPPWRDRKLSYLKALPSHGPSSILVSSADKLHNLRAIVTDYRQVGEGLWERFNPASDQLWYYSELAAIYEGAGSPLADELIATLDELKRLRSLQ